MYACHDFYFFKKGQRYIGINANYVQINLGDKRDKPLYTSFSIFNEVKFSS